MNPEIHYYIEGSKKIRPESKITVYVDGVSPNFRAGQDIELSHWVINKTPEKYKAPTSTEICFNYLDNPEKEYDLVVNNHLDVDGLLSMFVMAYPTLAQKYRDTLVNAAEMGDFMFWGTGKGLHIFMALSEIIKENKDPQDLAHQSFEQVTTIITQKIKPHPMEKFLRQQHALIEEGIIERKVLSERLVLYTIESSEEGDLLPKFLYGDPSPHFYKPIGLLPHVRNYYDKEKLQLTAIKQKGGIVYELCVPTYWWADTRHLWRPDWVKLQGQNYQMGFPALEKIVQHLNQNEKNICEWKYNPKLKLHGKDIPSYPVVLASINEEGNPSNSGLCLKQISDFFHGIF